MTMLPSRIARDVLEAMRGFQGSTRRMGLALAAISLASALLATALGITESTSEAIVSDLSAGDSQTIIAGPNIESAGGISWSHIDVVAGLRGVIASGAVARSESRRSVRRLSTSATLDPDLMLPVIVASSDMSSAAELRMKSGRFFNGLHDRADYPVAVLGSSAAELLQFEWTDGLSTIDLAGEPILVLGVLSRDGAGVTYANSVVLSIGATRDDPSFGEPSQLTILAKPGWAHVVADAIPLALAPSDPDRIRAVVVESDPVDLTTITSGLDRLVSTLTLSVGGFAVLVVANAAIGAVAERRSEIGLKRALGARRSDIATEFVVQFAALGLAGGVFGLSLGVLTVGVMSAWYGWAPSVPTGLAVVVPLAGLGTGVFASVAPALRASFLEPVIALQDD